MISSDYVQMHRSPLSLLLLSTHLCSNSTTCIPIIQLSTQTSSSLYARPPILQPLFSLHRSTQQPEDPRSEPHLSVVIRGVTSTNICAVLFFSTKVTQGNNKAFSMLRCIPTLRVKQTCSSLSHHNPNPPTPAAALLNPLSSDISNYDCPVLLIKRIYFNCI